MYLNMSLTGLFVLQVVDMRWGVREEAQDDHMTAALCMKEIHKCQRISVGPTFVVRVCHTSLIDSCPVSLTRLSFYPLTVDIALHSPLVDKYEIKSFIFFLFVPIKFPVFI